MKTPKFARWPLRLGWLIAALSLSNPLNAQWVAFNDHVAGTGTAPNTTRYIIPGVGATGVVSGPLKDINTGATLPVILSISSTGTISGGTGAAAPGVGTPAYNIFNGFVDFNPAGDTGTGAAV